MYALPPGELAVLDRCEGHPFCYRRKLLLVTDETGRRRRAHVYVLPVAEEAPPAPRYLGVLWQAYRRLGFDHEPLATVVIGGLVTATLLTLLVLPAVYSRFGGQVNGQQEATA